MSTEISVAVDAMSGDHGIDVTVPATLASLKKFDDTLFILVGDQQRITQLLESAGFSNHPRLQIIPSTEVVTMDEQPTQALRTKKDSSMRKAIEAVKENHAQACISAGNTGALIAISHFLLRTLVGIDRPAIASALPNKEKETYIMDLGANIDCKAEQLFQFAVMGSVLANIIEGIPNPRVGLLNIGSEAIKGNDQIKEANHLLENSTLNYYGYVEGNDVFSNKVDVIITDGFVGNVMLKAIEGTANFLADSLAESFKRNLLTRTAAFASLPILKSLAAKTDPRHYNGASLLGLQGVVIKSHGSADTTAFTRAIEIARLEAIRQIPQKIDAYLESTLVG